MLIDKVKYGNPTTAQELYDMILPVLTGTGNEHRKSYSRAALDERPAKPSFLCGALDNSPGARILSGRIFRTCCVLVVA